jgi:CDP-diacylglycerol--serine O-phosphatidyltransferase
MQNKTPKKRSMFRSFVPADFVTLANAGSGMASIFFCLNYMTKEDDAAIWGAFFLLPLALIFDYADGFIARKQRKRSKFGADLDSLADTVSFGVAPAVLGFALGMRGIWDCLVLIFFVMCGVSRLARFNVTAEDLSDETGKVKYFEGTPIPTSIVIVFLLALFKAIGSVGSSLPLGSVALGPWQLHPIVLIYALSGLAMVSTIRIPKI